MSKGEQQMTIEEIMTSAEQPATGEGLAWSSDSGLPKGWQYVTLAESIEIVRGVTFSKSDRRDEPTEGYIPCLRTSNIQAEIETDDLAYIPRTLVKRDDRFVQSGDLIISMSNSAELVGKVARAGFQHTGFAFGAFLSALRSRMFDSDFLYYLFRSSAIQGQLRATASQTVNIANLSLASMSKILLPLPPLNEQRRIVATLDRLFAHSKRARAELERVPRLVERMKQAVLAAAFDEAVQADAQYMTIGELAIQVRNGVSKRPENIPPGVPILKISAVRPMSIRMEEKRYYILDDGEDISSFTIQSGDLLFTRYNGNPDLVANCGMTRNIDGILIYPDKLIRVRLNRESADPQFVEALVATKQVRAALTPYIKSAAGQHGISGSDLKRISLPIPSLDEQREIVRRIEAAFARIDGMAAEAARATALLDRLDQATLAAAFRGEL